MTDDPKDLLIEQAVSAFRERDTRGRILASPVWHDLAPDAREELFGRQLESRRIEQMLSPDAMSGTVRAVMSRIR
jgi:hypothetical protein